MSRSHPARRALLSAALALAVVMAPVASADAPAPGSSLESARAALARWAETQAVISRERKGWQQAKELLTSRIEIVAKEITLVEEQLAVAREERGEAEEARAELVGQKESLQRTAGELGRHVGELEARTRALYASLPAALTEKAKPLTDRMPEDPAAAARVTLAERFQNVLGILGELNRLNSEITVATEIRPLSDGRPSEVRTIYLGLGQAYYVSAGGEAGVGRPGEAGWTWQADSSLAPRINQVLEILQNKSSPRFVPLPVTLQ